MCIRDSLYLLLCLCSTIPMTQQKTTFLYLLFERLVVVNPECVSFPEIECLFVNVGLNIFKQFFNIYFDTLTRHKLFCECVPSGQFHCSFLKIPWPHCNSYRNTFKFPFCKFESGTQVV